MDVRSNDGSDGLAHRPTTKLEPFSAHGQIDRMLGHTKWISEFDYTHFSLSILLWASLSWFSYEMISVSSKLPPFHCDACRENKMPFQPMELNKSECDFLEISFFSNQIKIAIHELRNHLDHSTPQPPQNNGQTVCTRDIYAGMETHTRTMQYNTQLSTHDDE